MVEIRRMEQRDVEACERVWHESWTTLRRSQHLPEIVITAEAGERMQRRIRHLLATDPDGAFVAEDDGRVVGLAQGLVRDGLWVLSLFAVATTAQGRGLGRRLLEAALGDHRDRPGLILCSRDPRAAGLYTSAGFDLHPAITAWGSVRHDSLPAVSDVVEGEADALDLVAKVDQRVWIASRRGDVEHLLDGGAEILVSEAGLGYVVVSGGSPMMLAAERDEVATDLLYAALTRARPDVPVEVRWLTAGQQWAVRASLRAGLALHPAGPVMLRGVPVLPSPFLASGAFG